MVPRGALLDHARVALLLHPQPNQGAGNVVQGGEVLVAAQAVQHGHTPLRHQVCTLLARGQKPRLGDRGHARSTTKTHSKAKLDPGREHASTKRRVNCRAVGFFVTVISPHCAAHAAILVVVSSPLQTSLKRVIWSGGRASAHTRSSSCGAVVSRCPFSLRDEHGQQGLPSRASCLLP